MSSVVNYKGAQIASVNNETKKLLTSGTWMEDDVEIVDSTPNIQALKTDSATPSEVVYIKNVTPDAGYNAMEKARVTVGAISPVYVGSMIPRHDSSDLTENDNTVTVPFGYYENNASILVPFDFRGKDYEYVSTPYALTETALTDTLYNGWSPSTTAKNIVVSADAGTFVADMVNYEYLLRWLFEFNAVYTSGTVPKAATDRQVIEIWQSMFRRPNSLANIVAENNAGNTAATYFIVPIIRYYNTNGGLTYAYSASYGVYCAATAPTFSSSTSDSPTVTVKTPVISARCSTTYFKTAMASAIDQTNSKFKLKGELYRCKPNGIVRQLYDHMIHLYNTGVS